MSQRPIVIVGGGPAGLTAAYTLWQYGVTNLLVLERESSAGGLPRHCGHSGFGVFDFHWPMKGPAYANALRHRIPAEILKCDTTVLALKANGELLIRDASGVQTLHAERVLLTTGIRETTRAASLVGGMRPFGVMNTGALQRWVYEKQQLPMRHPIVVGSEWVSFSSLLTLKHMGVKPQMLIEAGEEVLAPGPAALISDTVFGVPVHTDTQLVAIHGLDKVDGVTLRSNHTTWEQACDGVILSGKFVPETGIIRSSHLMVDPRTKGPAIDSELRCSDPSYFAAGNVLRPVEHSGVAAAEGRAAAFAILRDLNNALPPTELSTQLQLDPALPLQYLYPQRLHFAKPDHAALLMRARVSQPVSDLRLRWFADGVPLGREMISAKPTRRVQLSWPKGDWQGATQLTLRAEDQ
ncbi:FAD-dependent oxidoreductase [Leeia sp. TBRC 13508]|uniref:FAD-dependent oxidoreductase n=1 Tax=Leeia speluncae TaxID=2884804 RepID=A0ABS8D3V4_9NEIS|nr:FAD-dependent oxidoreductase [Leeia speluncae]MCB6182879.1 FAD-dependent oxidoreductase [Leeia speluncae]